MLYIGSCRYMYGYPWDYFPARLHTTREIIFFLENINNIEKVINDNPSDLTNSIFSDIYRSTVTNDSKKFIHKFMDKNINKNINKIIMEICSRKIRYYNDIPVNYFVSGCNINKYNLVEKILTDEEIELDLVYIVKLCKRVFNENTKVYIIPHLNLKTKSTLEYICERNKFVNLLECLCNKYNIKICNIGKYIESINNNCFIEDYMPDSRHYKTQDMRKIKNFLINETIGDLHI